jgi:predicted dehydrogenase
MPRTARPPIALVGCGRWGQNILRDLIRLGREVVVVDVSEDARQEARRRGAATVASSVAELPPVAGAIVATPTTTHPLVIKALRDRGVPVFCEKPLAADRASVAPLVRASDLFVMDKWRYHPGVEMLAEIARSQELGPVLGLRTTRIGWASPHEDIDPVWLLAPHDLSIALEILGTLPAPRVAVAERLRGKVTGLFAVLGEHPWLMFEVSVLTLPPRREVRLHCRDGLATLSDGYSEHVQVIRTVDLSDSTPPTPERRPISTELPLLRELRAFLEYLEGGPPPRSSAAEGVMIVNALADLRALAGLDGM